MFVKTKEELLEYIKGLTDGFRGEEPEPGLPRRPSAPG